MKTVLFCKNPYAFGILKPLHDEAIKKNFKVLWFVPEKLRDVFPFELDVTVTSSIAELVKFNADAHFVPGNEIPHYLNGLKVQIFHGLAGEKKGHFRIRHYFDLYLTQGPYFTERFLQLKNKYKNFDVIETGWPKLDGLFRKDTETEQIRTHYKEKHKSEKIILYAPTFSPSLTSSSLLFEPLFEFAEKTATSVLIKFHDLMDKTSVLNYQQKAKNYPNVEIVEERNILPYLKVADMLISDTSSVVYEFVLLNKPVISLRTSSENIHWKNILNASELEQAIKDEFEHDHFREQRKLIIEKYHPYTDGQSALRMLDVVEEYIRNHGVPKRRNIPLFRRYKMNRMFGKKPKTN